MEWTKFRELLGTTELRSPPAGKQDEGAQTLGEAFSCERISKPSRPASPVRAYASTNIPGEFSCAQLRYAAIVSQRARGNRLELLELARGIVTNFARARHTLLQLLPADAVNASRSAIVVGVPNSTNVWKGGSRWIYCSRSLSCRSAASKDLLDVWAFRIAILELGQRSLLGLHLGRIESSIGMCIGLWAAAVGRLRCIASLLEQTIVTTESRNVQPVCHHILHETFAETASAFNELAREQSTPLHWRRLRESHPGRLRNTVNRQPAMRGSGNRRCDSYGGRLAIGDRLRARQQYVRPGRTSLCVASSVASFDAAVATV